MSHPGSSVRGVAPPISCHPGGNARPERLPTLAADTWAPMDLLGVDAALRPTVTASSHPGGNGRCGVASGESLPPNSAHPGGNGTEGRALEQEVAGMGTSYV